VSWRDRANDEQLATFASAYVPSSRLWHLHAIKVALGHLDEVRASYVAQQSEDPRTTVSDSMLYGPVTAGLYAAALGETVMYAEDLFTLLRGLRSPQRFVADTVSFPGSKVVGLVGKLERLDVDGVSKAFFVPTGSWLGLDGDDLVNFDAGRAVVHERLQQIIQWWRKYRFLQQQYKHGMTLALQPFGADLPEATIAARRAGEPPPIYALDNEAISDETLARSGGTLAFVGQPGAASLAHAGELVKDRNLLRYALSTPTPFADILEIGKLCCDLTTIAIHHRTQLLPTRAGRYTVQVPTPTGTWLCVETDAAPPLLGDFVVRL